MIEHPTLQAAIEAAQAGLAVVFQSGKRAIEPGWNRGPAASIEHLREHFREGLNIAFRSGPTSRIEGDAIVVLDVDIRSDDEADKAQARAAFAELVGTLKATVKTGGGGAHLYMRMPADKLPSAPATVLRQSDKLVNGKSAWTLELLAAEHAVTMPPSIHPSGRPYRWVNGGLAHIEHTPESLLAALAAAQSQSTVAESQSRAMRTAPEPLRRPTPPPEPYPLAELGPILAPAAAAMRGVIQAPDAVCGASVLAAASLAVQGLADVRIDGRSVPLSLWMLTIAESGERKTAVDGEAMLAAREYEKELAKLYDADVSEHQFRLAEWEARVAAAKKGAGKHKGVGLADALRDVGPAPPAPLVPRVMVADFTAEGLSKLLAVGWPSVGAFTDEAALVFGGHGMTKETTMRTAATLCKLWDSGTLDRVRSLDGATKLYGRRLALHLLAQPVIAERALSDDVLAGQGFLARCLIAWPASTAGTRPYAEQNMREHPAIVRMAQRFIELFRLPLPMAQGERQELSPRLLELDPAAKRAWIALHDAIETGMAPGGPFATVKPWASKTPEQCLRTAGVLTLLDDANAASIDAATIERASELALWHLGEAVRVAGTAELSPEVRDAEALLNWCHETRRDLLHSRDALRLGPARIRERDTFTQAVAVLVSAGWATPVEGGAVIDDAHRRHVWRIEPKRED